MFYAIFDVVGMIVFATGVLWFAQERALIIPNFPTSKPEAIAAILSGGLLMFWAATRILRELLKMLAKNAQRSL